MAEAMLADSGGAYAHRVARHHPNGHLAITQPGAEAPLVAGHLDPGDAGTVASPAGVRDAPIARDEPSCRPPPTAGRPSSASTRAAAASRSSVA
jgi:hypothetical protein